MRNVTNPFDETSDDLNHPFNILWAIGKVGGGTNARIREEALMIERFFHEPGGIWFKGRKRGVGGRAPRSR